jgi:sRNA-binding regulator protein Hfq
MEKQLVPALAVLVFCLLYTAAIAAQAKAQASTSADEAKMEVQRLGFGKPVKVKLHNGMKMRGRITGLTDDEFVVTDSKTGSMMKVAYTDVAEIRKQREMPRVLQAAFIGIAVTAAVVATLGVLMLAFPD